jgi:hypothetical protein
MLDHDVCRAYSEIRTHWHNDQVSAGYTSKACAFLTLSAEYTPDSPHPHQYWLRVHVGARTGVAIVPNIAVVIAVIVQKGRAGVPIFIAVIAELLRRRKRLHVVHFSNWSEWRRLYKVSEFGTADMYRDRTTDPGIYM